MAIANKPDEKVFAGSAQTNEVVEFPDIPRGFAVTFETSEGIPAMEHFNHLMRRIDESILYLLQRGWGQWSATLDYPENALVEHNGSFYVAKQAGKGYEPSTQTTVWDKLQIKKDDIDALLATKAPINHTHSIAQVIGLQNQLNGKASTSHTHQITHIAGLQSALQSKAAASHKHNISDVNNLQTELNAKASVNHTHSIDNVTGLQSSLNDKANRYHQHEIDGINGLSSALNNKANSSHSHAISNISGLQNELNAKALKSQSIVVIDRITSSKVADVVFCKEYELMMIWKTIGSYTGYASPEIGSVVFGTSQSRRPFELDLVGGTVSKTTYRALLEWAKQNNFVVSSSNYIVGAFHFVDTSSGLKLPDLRNRFLRFTGTNADNANARPIGGMQNDAMRKIYGTVDLSWNGDHSVIGNPTGVFSATRYTGKGDVPPSSGTNPGTLVLDTSRSIPTSTEVRPINTAFAPRIIGL